MFRFNLRFRCSPLKRRAASVKAQKASTFSFTNGGSEVRGQRQIDRSCSSAGVKTGKLKQVKTLTGKFSRLSLNFTKHVKRQREVKRDVRPDLNCTGQTGWTGCDSSDGQTGKTEETETRRKHQVGQTASQSNRQVCEPNRPVDFKQADRRTNCRGDRQTDRETSE